jgi:hypothetical protein
VECIRASVQKGGKERGGAEWTSDPMLMRPANGCDLQATVSTLTATQGQRIIHSTGQSP